MDHQPHLSPSLKAVCLLLSLLLCGAAPSWAGSPSRSRPESNRKTSSPAASAMNLPHRPAVTDPCAPIQAMETKAAAPAPSHGSTSALASLMTRARNQQGPALARLERGNPLALDLWSSRVSAPASTDDAETSLALRRLIRQVQSVTFNDKSQAQPSTPRAEMAPAIPTAVAPIPDKAEVEAPLLEPVTVASSEATPALSPKAQKTLESLRQDPSRVGDPLEVAELLFLSGRPAAAAPFYAEALRRISTDAARADDRAWILFQLGNCLRETDPAKAQEAYTKLIAEYPNSPWTEMARAGGRLLTWYQNTRPDQLVTPRKP